MKRYLAALAATVTIFFTLSSCASEPNAFQREVRGNPPVCSVEIFPTGKGDSGSFLLCGIYPEKTWLEGSWVLDSSGVYALEPSALHWFNNWADGWTEARFDCGGKLTLTKEGNSWHLAVVALPAPLVPTEARIRYRDTVLIGDAALKALGNRWDRILAASALLKMAPIYPGSAQGYPPFIAGKKDHDTEFRVNTAHYLFPEIAGWKNAELAAKYKGAETSRAEDIRWNTAYTKDTFPEEFRAVRDSGTLFRDWEESAELFYLACWNAEIFARVESGMAVRVTETREKK